MTTKSAYSHDIIVKYYAIVEFLKTERVKHHTQSEMAQFLECNVSTIKAFESGKIIRFDFLEQYTFLCTPLHFNFDLDG